MTVLQELLEWSQDRPTWQRDALRRLVLHGELSDDDIRARVYRFDQASESGLISFVADMPFGDPNQLRMAESLGAMGHPGKPEIGGVGEQRSASARARA